MTVKILPVKDYLLHEKDVHKLKLESYNIMVSLDYYIQGSKTHGCANY